MSKVNDEREKLPEFAVKFETIRHFFYPPLARSTFHDLVNRGQGDQARETTIGSGIKGWYAS